MVSASCQPVVRAAYLLDVQLCQSEVAASGRGRISQLASLLCCSFVSLQRCGEPDRAAVRAFRICQMYFPQKHFFLPGKRKKKGFRYRTSFAAQFRSAVQREEEPFPFSEANV